MQSTRLDSSKNDLNIASRAIDVMRETLNFDIFKENWENYLFRIERAWEVSDRIAKNKNGFQEWNKPYLELRKKDPLLVFLRQARHSEAHCISPTVDKDLELVVKEKTGRCFGVDSVSSKIENGTLSIDIKSPDILLDMQAELIPTSPKVVRFKNRGKWYNTPWHHLHKRITDLHPVYIAELGHTFYSAYIDEAEHWLNNH